MNVIEITNGSKVEWMKDVKKFIKFLDHKNEWELRFIYPRWIGEKPPLQFWVKTEEEFIKKCEEFNGKANLYVGINERKENGNKDEDVEYITNVGHDIDAHDGNPESFVKAQEVALKIKEMSVELGYKEPMILCSGRGFWVIHHITPIKNTSDNILRIKEFGRRIKEKYEIEGIELDSTVYNPSRITRIPGTTNVSDKDNVVESFIINDPKVEEDFKLSEQILDIKIKKYEPSNLSKSNINPDDWCPFMDYCLTHEIPSGERHKTISRNMSIYISNHPDKELLREQYCKVQRGSNTELTHWLKNVEENINTSPGSENSSTILTALNSNSKTKLNKRLGRRVGERTEAFRYPSCQIDKPWGFPVALLTPVRVAGIMVSKDISLTFSLEGAEVAMEYPVPAPLINQVKSTHFYLQSITIWP